jgi:hypothetical protein
VFILLHIRYLGCEFQQSLPLNAEAMNGWNNPLLNPHGLLGKDRDKLTFQLWGTHKVYYVKQDQTFKNLLA